MDESQRQSTGAVIRTLREAQGLTRQELVDQTGETAADRVSLEMLAKVEQGKKAPSVKTLRKLALALGLEPADLSRRVAWWEAALEVGESSSFLRAGVIDVARLGARAMRPLGAGSVIGGGIPLATVVAGKIVKDARDTEHIDQALRRRLSVNDRAAELAAQAAELAALAAEGTDAEVEHAYEAWAAAPIADE